MNKLNRTILFRGRRSDNKNWVIGSLHVNEAASQYVISTGLRDYSVDPKTVGQYSGFAGVAKDGFTEKQIYEGDVILVESTNKILAVQWYGGAFRVVTPKEKAALDSGIHPYMSDYRYPELLVNVIDSTPVRVIGNVYDNPELMRFKKEDRPPIPD